MDTYPIHMDILLLLQDTTSRGQGSMSTGRPHISRWEDPPRIFLGRATSHRIRSISSNIHRNRRILINHSMGIILIREIQIPTGLDIVHSYQASRSILLLVVPPTNTIHETIRDILH